MKPFIMLGKAYHQNPSVLLFPFAILWNHFIYRVFLGLDSNAAMAAVVVAAATAQLNAHKQNDARNHSQQLNSIWLAATW